MPQFGSALRLNRIPIIALVPEKSGIAPTTPTSGQLWCDTSVNPNVDRYYDGATWQPWLILGTIAGTAAAGNDARLSDQRTAPDGSITGGTAGSGVKIAAATIIDANVAAANKDGATTTPSMRTIGTSALQALAGNTTLSSLALATADVNLNGFGIVGSRAPVAGTDLVRLTDLNAAQAGIDNKPSARLIATTNQGVSGLAAIDGVTPIAGDRILLQAQTTATQNGSYVAAVGAWTRTSDVITPQAFWLIEEGTSFAGTQWKVSTAGAIILGTTPITINQFAASGVSYTGTTNRVTVSGTSIDISAAYAGQASITTVGTLTLGALGTGFTDVPVAQGGTGASTPATARTSLGASQAGFALTLGALVAGTPLVVTHNLGTQDVIAQVRDATTNEYVFLDIINVSTNTVTVTAGVAYASNALRIVVLPVA